MTLAAALAALALGAQMLLAATPAAAVLRDDGDDPGPGLSAGQTVLIFVGIPLAIALVVALFVFLPRGQSHHRYRPGLQWWAAPVWFAGPAAQRTDEVAPVVVSEDVGQGVTAAASTLEGGGASARW